MILQMEEKEKQQRRAKGKGFTRYEVSYLSSETKGGRREYPCENAIKSIHFFASFRLAYPPRMTPLLLLFCFLSSLMLSSSAFVVHRSSTKGSMISHSRSPRPLFMSKYSYDNVKVVGYSVSIQKPLGVVFAENGNPYYGLVVDEITQDSNGSAAGLRKGDQLLAVNGECVVGDDFDNVMSMLKSLSGTLKLQLYRGNVRDLAVTLNNMYPDVEDEDESAPVIMDENYESPVKIEVKEEEPLDVGKAFKALGGLFSSDEGSKEEGGGEKKEKKKGLFGGMFSGETIQLEGDDATGLTGSPRKKQGD